MIEKTMTTEELNAEHRYWVSERLSILEAPEPPLTWQRNMATEDADRHITAVLAQSRPVLAGMKAFREMELDL